MSSSITLGGDDSINRGILQKLKDDDPALCDLRVCSRRNGMMKKQNCQYVPGSARGMGLLGQYVRRCTNVLKFSVSIEDEFGADVAPILLGLQGNRSIRELRLWKHIPRDFFRMLTPFIASNPNLVKFDVYNCEMDVEQYRALSSALREGKSLKTYYIRRRIGDRYDHEESIVAIAEALKMHPRLESLAFWGYTMGRNACANLSDLFRQSAGLQTLGLGDAAINDSGIEALMGGLAQCRGLKRFQLARNPSITARGWRAVGALLEDPDSVLQHLDLEANGINDTSAKIIAHALARNGVLEELDLNRNPEITSTGWAAFSDVLYDTTSVNNTFLSNHTLRMLEGPGRTLEPSSLTLRSVLAFNEQRDKNGVAFRKILLYWVYFDMQPLFEWDLKVLPPVVEWFERAAAYEIECKTVNRNRKLAAIYQFIRGMPELTVDGITGASKKSANVGGEKRPHSTAFKG